LTECGSTAAGTVCRWGFSWLFWYSGEVPINLSLLEKLAHVGQIARLAQWFRILNL
jgi:hypothetical protein